MTIAMFPVGDYLAYVRWSQGWVISEYKDEKERYEALTRKSRTRMKNMSSFGQWTS